MCLSHAACASLDAASLTTNRSIGNGTVENLWDELWAMAVVHNARLQKYRQRTLIGLFFLVWDPFISVWYFFAPENHVFPTTFREHSVQLCCCTNYWIGPVYCACILWHA